MDLVVRMPRASRTHLGHRKSVERYDRPSSNERGYTYRWHKARRSFLIRNPLCAECLRHSKTTLATCVDHIVPHRGDMVKFWDAENWQGLCVVHHNQKSAKEKL